MPNLKGKQPPKPPSWKEMARNKKQKKRILQGEEDRNTKTINHKGRRELKRKETAQEALAVMQSLTECMEDLEDPRIDRRRRHLLVDIVVICVCATIANADGWKDMHAWAEEQHGWLKKFLELPNGIPSMDTLRRTVSRVNPEQFQKCFFRWLAKARKNLGGIIALDGKTLRRSNDGDKDPLHIVSAWATEQSLTLGQQRVDGKSNEITAIPELLRVLELPGTVVTIDAMGCQKAIAEQIIDQGGEYCLSAKDNQPKLVEEIREAFAAAMEDNFDNVAQQEMQTSNKGHGREEMRYYCTMPVPDTFATAKDWKGLNSLGMTISSRKADGPSEVRYYITSFSSDVDRFAKAVRGHWGIENSLHWVMDVTFGEDASRIRKGHGGENVSWLRRLAISIIKHDTSVKDSVRAKRLRASYNIKHLERILAAVPVE